MLTIDEILEKADEITLELQENSITPPRVGELLTSITEQLRLLSSGGTLIGASKLSELSDVMLLNAKDNDILQKIGTKWTNAALDLTRINQLMSWFKLDADGNLYTELSLYSKKELSAYGAGNGTEPGSIVTSMAQLVDVALTSPLSGQILVYDGTHWRNQPLSVTPDLSDYATIAWSNLNFALSEHVHSWGTITDKPVSFTPSTHAHAWNDITGKPTTFAPSAHNHLWADLSDKPTTFAPSAHDHSFASLTAKPTTLSGYGITDAITSTVFSAHTGNQNAEKHLTAQQLSDLLALINGPASFWKLDVNGNLYTDKNVYSTLAVSAYGVGSGGGGEGGASALYQLVDASITSPVADHVLVYNGTHWQNRPKSYLLADYSLTTHGHTFASLTGKPTTLSGYGITDALLASAYTASDVLTKLKTVDGSGTGLDADLLDGKHGSYFCDYDERTLGYNVNYNTLSYDFQNKSFIVSPVHSKNFTGQTNYPFDDYGQMITFGGLNTLFPFQLAVSENATKVKIRSKYRPTNNTVIDAVWADVYTSNSANRTDVDWAAKNMTVQTDITLNGLTSTNKSLKTLLDKFDIDTAGNLVVKTNLYSTGEVTAYSSGTGVSGLKLMGDLNANGKAIYSVNYLQAGLSVQGGSAIIGSDPLGLFGTGMNVGLYNADNDTVIAAYDDYNGMFYYANNSVTFSNYTNALQSPAFKFGSWTFRQDASGRLGIYNGATEVACFNTDGTYVNL